MKMAEKEGEVQRIKSEMMFYKTEYEIGQQEMAELRKVPEIVVNEKVSSEMET